mgnify:CR=1 FL=1
MTTIAQAIAQSPLPRLETRLLLQHITGLSHSQLITRDGDLLPPEQEAQWRQLCRRREQGEPVAYLLGSREFYGRTFTVNRHVLIPRPETEHLLEAALQRLPENGVLWDLGTGSGIIAVSAKCERPDARVFASDISAEALAVAQQNAAAWCAPVSFAQGAWFAANQVFRLPQHSVHVIASNPPYIEADDPHLQQGDLRYEPPAALTDFADGLAHIRHIAQHAPAYLRRHGWLLLEHGYDQETPVQALLRDAGFADVFTRRDLAGQPRVSGGRWLGDGRK